MKTLTVKDLKQYLATHELSPAKFAKDVQLSHMTIRRWLKRPDRQEIPEKYYPLLAARLDPGMTDKLDVQKLMSDIEVSGHEYEDMDQLETDFKNKLQLTKLDTIFTDFCKNLYQTAKSNKTTIRNRAIAVGALLYFINPIDLIPDHIPVIGYLDDLAVLSLATTMINAGPAKSSEEKQAELAEA